MTVDAPREPPISAHDPRALEEMATQSPNYQEWQASNLEAIAEISPWAMLMESFGLLDLVFAFLGIGTAFRLGSQEF